MRLLIIYLPGFHAVNVTDAHGCIRTDGITVTQPLTELVLVTSSASVSCFGSQDGIATATVTGGVPPYTYSWSNGETTPNYLFIFSGNYSVIVTDANFCSIISNILVNQPLPLTIPINSTDVSCYNGSNAIATANPNEEQVLILIYGRMEKQHKQQQD